METESESQQPPDLPRRGRLKRRSVVLINLLLSVFLLLSLCAAWAFIPIARVPAVCVFHHKPWWITLVGWSAFLLIPASIIFGLDTLNPLRKEDRDRHFRRLGSLNIILAVLLFLSLVGAEFLYFVCQL